MIAAVTAGNADKLSVGRVIVAANADATNASAGIGPAETAAAKVRLRSISTS